jgi:60kDa lysophospholipase
LLTPTFEAVVPKYAEDAAAWTSTASEAAATEAALLPFLMHTAVARDDLAGFEFCLQAADGNSKDNTPARIIPGGIVNCIDPASGRAPLHTAALNGSLNSVKALLEAGALVHHRDNLGHTALYYVRLGCSQMLTTHQYYPLGCPTGTRGGRRPFSQGWRKPGRFRR